SGSVLSGSFAGKAGRTSMSAPSPLKKKNNRPTVCQGEGRAHPMRAKQTAPVAELSPASTWFRTPTALVLSQERTDGLLAVYSAIAIHANSATGECWPSISRIAQISKKSRRQAIRHIATLERLGFLVVTRLEGAKNRYLCRWDMCTE